MTDAPLEKITVIVRGKEIVLDPSNMGFNENTLGMYMEKEYAWVDYFGKQIEFANREYMNAEIEYEALYSRKYIASKDKGSTENYAKAESLSDPEVITARKKVAEHRETVGLLRQHRSAWDKNHANGQNRGHTLRRELEILGHQSIKTNDHNLARPMPDTPTCDAEDFFS